MKEGFFWKNVCNDLINNIEFGVESTTKIGIVGSILYIIKTFYKVGTVMFRKDF